MQMRYARTSEGFNHDRLTEEGPSLSLPPPSTRPLLLILSSSTPSAIDKLLSHASTS